MKTFTEHYIFVSFIFSGILCKRWFNIFEYCNESYIKCRWTFEQSGQLNEHWLQNIILFLVLFCLQPRVRNDAILYFNLLWGVIINHIIRILNCWAFRRNKWTLITECCIMNSFLFSGASRKSDAQKF